MDRKRQEIILHIGHGKTGSSYLQSCLALSAERLREAGIEYPELRPFARAKQGGISSGNLGPGKAFVQTVTEVADRHTKASRLLFSSEWLFGRIAYDCEAVATLQQSFDVTVLLFIREFLAHAISEYGQAVKRRGCTKSLGTFLAEHRHPQLVLQVLQVLQAAERTGSRVAVFNYSRHTDRLLDVFAGACGIAPETLVRPPMARVNRSLDEAELALIRRVNAVLGMKTGARMANALCERLPMHPSGPQRILRQDYERYRARIAPVETAINRLLPPSERYGAEEPIVVEYADGAPGRAMGFTAAQLDVLAESLGPELIRLRTSKTSGFRFRSWTTRTIRSLAVRPSHYLSRFLIWCLARLGRKMQEWWCTSTRPTGPP